MNTAFYALIILIIVATIITILLLVLKDTSTTTSEVQAVAVGLPVDSTDTVIDGHPGMLYSYDGKTWNRTTGTSFNYGADSFYSNGGAGYGNNLWVAAGHNIDTENNILYSSNGINWEPASMTGGASIFYNGNTVNHRRRGNNAFYANNLWLALGKSENSNNILYSSNGINWEPASMTGGTSSIFPGSSILNGAMDVAYGKDKWVAVGHDENNNNILYSTNGISWQLARMSGGTSPFIASTTSGANQTGGLGVTYDSSTSTWYAVGGATDGNNILSSSDGICWQVVNAEVGGLSFFPNGAFDIFYSNEKDAFLATGTSIGGDNLLFTKNPAHWEDTILSNGISTPFSGAVLDGLAVTYSNNLNLWLAGGGAPVDQKGGAVLNSSNGTSWNTTIMTNGTSYPFGDSQFSVAFDVAVRN